MSRRLPLVTWTAARLRALDRDIFPAPLPRASRIVCLLCMLVALCGLAGTAVKRARRAAGAVWSLSILESGWPVPAEELRRFLPQRGRVLFVTDEPEGQARYSLGHLQNKLVPLIVLPFPGAGALPLRHVVMRFASSRREEEFLSAHDVEVVARCSSHFSVGVRRR